MENCARAAGLIACLFFTAGVSAGELADAQTRSVTGLEFFEQTYGPAASTCELGFLASGSPLIVTRTSSWVADDGIAVSDRVAAVDGLPVSDYAGLRSALASRNHTGAVDLSIYRGDEALEIKVSCQDATKILLAREEALLSAAESRWNDCIHATYAEELFWGGPNSLSAGLRLWCHQASLRTNPLPSTESIRPIGAFLMYEYAVQLLEELSHVPGNNDEIHARLSYQTERISDSGHEDLANSLNQMLATLHQP
jgi:hypothetical protein